MKRFISVLLASAMMLASLTGCNSDGKTATPSPTPAVSENTGTQKETEKETGKEEKGNSNENVSAPQSGGTFIVGLAGDPQNFNPDIGSDDYGLSIFNNVFNCLVSMDMDMNIIPDLASSWEFSDDNMEITFHLVENAQWHDGTPFTSADIKFTFDTIAKESGQASSNLKTIDEITCPDDYTVVFKMKEPDASILGFVSWYATFIMPKHIYEGTDWATNPANQSPIGTGPFKFVEFQSGVAVTLEKNENYWNEGPYLDRLIFQIIPDRETEYQAWKNGEIDLMFQMIPGTDFDKYDNNPDYVSRVNFYANRTYFTFNLNEGRFSDIRLRQAFNYALNREEVSAKGLKGNGAPAEYYISPLFDWAINKDAKIPAQNIEEAKRLLEEAGYTADANGIYLTVSADVFSGFEDALVVCQANLLDAGIKMEFNNLEYSAWVEKVKEKHDFEITVLAGYQGPDIGAIRYRVYYDEAGNNNNLASYNNPRMHELVEEGAKVFSQEERKPYYMEIQTILAEDLPMVFINENGTKMVTSSKIHGVPNIDDSVRNLVRNTNYSRVWMEK